MANHERKKEVGERREITDISTIIIKLSKKIKTNAEAAM
jgi:hypothetical protein